jgi:hypothetical protein
LGDEKLIEVMKGLNEGDRIVSTGAGALREGDKDRAARRGRADQGGGGAGRAAVGAGGNNARGGAAWRIEVAAVPAADAAGVPRE